MNIQKYLNRIKYYSEVELTKEVMFSLQKQNLLNIPFENLDIPYGKKIKLDLDNIFQKIIINKRGGFCYKINLLFNELLKEIGFNTFLISGRVYNENGTYRQEFDHMAIIAIIAILESKLYLVDVGFGELILDSIDGPNSISETIYSLFALFIWFLFLFGGLKKYSDASKIQLR
ncbi:arylamine N-acetyltransferase [Flavobacterium sp.]|uniref:arylamine N-acetyltransferase family protein n=1 Tax=Flavobacterium sp. TaxID=239 RepID=UPI00286A248B|nr:arylamine N-acetyltransferase [Flavobacterium sp.]